MLENLLQFDALLDQYELAAVHRMPDDLTVSIVLRCLDGPTGRQLEMIMDEGLDCAKLKDKLILLDKNTKAWSGDNFLKNLQAFNRPTSSSSSNYQGPAPMEVDQVQAKGKASPKGNRKAKRAVGLVCHMVANTVDIRKVEAKENKNTKERKETRERIKASSKKAKVMVVETVATHVVYVEDMATGEMSALSRTMSIR